VPSLARCSPPQTDDCVSDRVFEHEDRVTPQPRSAVLLPLGEKASRAAAESEHNRMLRAHANPSTVAVEHVGLTWADVEPDAITVRRAVSTRSGTIVESTPKTASGRRVVAIDGETFRVLNVHCIAQREELRSVEISDDVTPERVFTTRLGGTLDERNLRLNWYRLQDLANVPRARLHDARHMHISMLIGQGIDIRTVADRAGHADAVLTLQLYAHALDAQKRRAALPLEVLLGSSGAEAVVSAGTVAVITS
jgi:integrase